jgi:hypothetical protein
MATITIEAEADHSLLLDSMLQSTDVDPVSIIMTIDEYVSCESFTLKVIKELSESLFNDYDSHSQLLAGQVFTDLVGDGSLGPIPPFGSESTQQRWENISALRDKLSQVVKLVTEISRVVF